jgi:hypothetical protein
MPQKLTRAQIKAGLDAIPIETLLSSGEGKTPKISHKQREFARAIALGQSKAQAYRDTHNATRATITTEPYKLARDPRIAREVEAYQLALEAEKHRTPAQLKALLVQQLVQHSLDDEFPPAQRMKALQLIGQLFEVGAFLERKETTVVHKSTDIRTRLLERLGAVSDVQAKPDDALTLLDEIRGAGSAHGPDGDPTGRVAEPAAACATGDVTHTIPLIRSPEKTVGTPSEISDVVSDFDKE